MLEIEIKEVIILICESTEKDTNRLMIGNSGSEQETFCFPSGQGRLPFKRKYLVWDKTVGTIEEIVSGRTCKGPEVGETYHPTLSRSQLKPSSALCPHLLCLLLCTVATGIFSKLLFYGRKNTTQCNLHVWLMPFPQNSSCSLLFSVLVICPSISDSLSSFVIR